MEKPLLMVNKVFKNFGAVEAVCDVSFNLYPGEILGLVGDNGAGKSTLIKIVSGVHEPDRGEIFWKESLTRVQNPKKARDIGIETIYQDLALSENLTISANIFLGKEITKKYIFGLIKFLSDKKMEKMAREVLDRLNIEMKSYSEIAGNLSGGQKQAVAITRAILWGAELIIMDEPTAALGVAERRSVLDLIKKLRDEAISVILISHNLNDILTVTDRIVVMQRGLKVGDVYTKDTNEESLVRMMLGGENQND